MKIVPIRTRKLNPPKDNIFDILNSLHSELREKDILFITSKVLAIHQGLCVPVSSVKNKNDLIKKESDTYISNKESIKNDAVLTIKNNIFVPSAGIDESNANGYYILWPKNPEKEAKIICDYLKKKFSIKELAVVITDSNVSPMRYGSLGMSIGFYGLKPLKSYVNKKDIFNHTIKVTQSNIVDALSAMGVLNMGEGNEQTPMLIIHNADFVEFTDRETYKDLFIPVQKDIYYPLLSNFSGTINNLKLQSLFAVFVALLIGMNLLGGKIINLFGIPVSVAIFMAPFTFLITDIVEDVYGKNIVRYFIVGGLISLIIMFLFTEFFVHLVPHVRYGFNREYKIIFGISLRMMIASIVAFLLSQTHDAIAFEWWKKITNGKALWLRNNLSTIVSQLIDTFVFMIIAFYHITTKFTLSFVISMASLYYLLKALFAVINTPFVYIGVRWLRNKRTII